MVRSLILIVVAASSMIFPTFAHSMTIEAPLPNAVFQRPSVTGEFNIPFSVTLSSAVGAYGACKVELSSTGRTDPARDTIYSGPALFFSPEVVASGSGCTQRDPSGTVYTGTLTATYPVLASGTYHLMVYREYYGTTFQREATNAVPVLLETAVAPTPVAPTPVPPPADTTAPSTPGTLAAVSKRGHIMLSWGTSTDDVGIVAYVIYRHDGTKWVEVGRTTSTTFSYYGPPGRHSFSVAAVDAAGNGSNGNGPASTSISETTRPTAPSRLRAIRVTRTSVSLSWNRSRDASGISAYEVQLLVNRRWVSRPNAYAASTFVRGLGPNRFYPVRVRAVDYAGNKSYWYAASVRTPR